MNDDGVLGRLGPQERALVSRAARKVRLDAGTRLFTDGERARGCWVIRTGHIALDLSVPGRGQVVVQTLGGGDVLGWSWLVPPFRWEFGAVAVTETTAVELDTDRLHALAGQNPRFGYALTRALFEALARRLHATRARLLDLYGVPK
ncbi:Crp/Fnr family transcriptional regulator [Amycolatopsis anabasis]|uniref:Crp/Fnr family transcriptional regulator n=1 Tax=Amycolatopsis anabasis TaxID=1840409 RepID=UPI00131DAE6E|nr:cyclic nucleotide-binding domain-containing protein [Amycolatopsis anabasis]